MIYSFDSEIAKTYDEDITVTSGARLTIRGITNRTIHICSNSTCILYGIHKGNVIVDADCSFTIYGTFSGNIENYGSIEIYGVAEIKNFKGNHISICKNAIVNGKTYSADSSF